MILLLRPDLRQHVAHRGAAEREEVSARVLDRAAQAGDVAAPVAVLRVTSRWRPPVGLPLVVLNPLRQDVPLKEPKSGIVQLGRDEQWCEDGNPGLRRRRGAGVVGLTQKRRHLIHWPLHADEVRGPRLRAREKRAYGLPLLWDTPPL